MNLQKIRTLRSDKHWDYFAEFCRFETAVGGPDPHMKVVGHLARRQNLKERIWRGMCYIGFYNVPSAEKLWQSWPYELATINPSALEKWIHDFWPGFTTRRERKCVRSADKMARYFLSALEWIKRGAPEWADPEADWKENYEKAWEDVSSIYTMGRYVALKFLEYGTRYCAFPIELPDLRPEGGWSPRESLCLLFPEMDEQLAGDDSALNCQIANNCAFAAQHKLQVDYAVNLSLYDLQVLLCDYKQCYAGKRQFPGRSQDSEIMYHDKIQPWWEEQYAMDLPTEMFRARYDIFPHEALGELNGWRNVRVELGDVLREHGYMWSDLIYKYHPGFDLDHPVRRDGAETNFPKIGQATGSPDASCAIPKVRRPARGLKFAGIKVHEIVPGLYQRGRFDRYTKEQKVRFLEESGINIVVSLIKAVDDHEIYDHLALYQHYPLPDNDITVGDSRALSSMACNLASAIRNGSKVLCHCNMGRNRSGLLNALILTYLRGCSGHEAIEIVRAARPNALANERFVQFLEGIKC